MIIDSPDALRLAVQANSEDEHLEFKEAKQQYSVDKLTEYCAALANEGGGSLILGVTDARPRRISGTAAFPDLSKIKGTLFDRLRRRIDIEELQMPEGRVLVFRSPPAPPGHPIGIGGRYLMRMGENLVPMTSERLSELLLRDRGDLSAETIAATNIDSLDTALIERFRALCAERARKRGNDAGTQTARAIEIMKPEQLLEDVNLLIDGGVTGAALVMLGTARALDRCLPQAEVIFEYRSSDANVDYQERHTFRRGFLGFMDEIWGHLAKRNEIQSFQAGLIRHQVPTFAERSVREAILNAVCHRSYADQGSVLIRQFPRRLEVESPGGFPTGVSAANILSASRPRNRRLHEAMERCGLVERSGQGADLMFREAIVAAKPQPSYAGSDDHTVRLVLDGQVRDERLLAFLERAGAQTVEALDVVDLIAVDALSRGADLEPSAASRLLKLRDLGLVERVGRGKWILSRALYMALGRKGTYTRQRGLDWETEKALLLRHLKDSPDHGSPIGELRQVLPDRGLTHIKTLLTELRKERQIHLKGVRRAGRWFIGGGDAAIDTTPSKQKSK